MIYNIFFENCTEAANLKEDLNVAQDELRVSEEKRERDAATAESAINNLQLQIKSKTGDLSIFLILVIKSVGL